MAHARRLRVAAVLVAAAWLLGACGAPAVQAPETPAPVGQEAPPAEPPVAVPTRGTGAQEVPLPRGQVLPVLTTAVAGTGSGNLVAPDAVCIFWSWGGEGLPDLTDGLSFHIGDAAVVPESWQASHDVCELTGGQWCENAEISVDSSGCLAGFVRSGPAQEHAYVAMVGSLRCTEPLSLDDCVALAKQIDDSPDVSPNLDLEAVAGGGG